MKHTFIIIFLVSFSGLQAQGLKELILKQNEGIIEVEIHPFQSDSSICFVNLIAEKDWWEELTIVKYQNKELEWEVNFDKKPIAQSILSFREVKMNGLQGLFFEVFDQTHQGNGSYYLYQLDGSKAKLLLSTQAVDAHIELDVSKNNSIYSQIFKDGQLFSEYIDLNDDQIGDVVLKGFTQMVDEEKGIVIEEYFTQKVFLFDKKNAHFIEDKRQIKGIDD